MASDNVSRTPPVVAAARKLVAQMSSAELEPIVRVAGRLREHAAQANLLVTQDGSIDIVCHEIKRRLVQP